MPGIAGVVQAANFTGDFIVTRATGVRGAMTFANCVDYKLVIASTGWKPVSRLRLWRPGIAGIVQDANSTGDFTVTRASGPCVVQRRLRIASTAN